MSGDCVAVFNIVVREGNGDKVREAGTVVGVRVVVAVCVSDAVGLGISEGVKTGVDTQSVTIWHGISGVDVIKANEIGV